jgi:hypothetical protein
MDVEQGQKYRNAHRRQAAEAEFRGRHGVSHAQDRAIGRRKDKALAHRDRSARIAKEKRERQRRDQAEEPQNPGERKRKQGGRRRDPGKLITIPVNWGE